MDGGSPASEGDGRGAGGLRVRFAACVRPCPRRSLRAAAQRDELDGPFARGEAVLTLVGGVDCVRDRFGRGALDGRAQLVRLPGVARVCRPAQRDGLAAGRA